MCHILTHYAPNSEIAELFFIPSSAGINRSVWKNYQLFFCVFCRWIMEMKLRSQRGQKLELKWAEWWQWLCNHLFSKKWAGYWKLQFLASVPLHERQHGLGKGKEDLGGGVWILQRPQIVPQQRSSLWSAQRAAWRWTQHGDTQSYGGRHWRGGFTKGNIDLSPFGWCLLTRWNILLTSQRKIILCRATLCLKDQPFPKPESNSTPL